MNEITPETPPASLACPPRSLLAGGAWWPAGDGDRLEPAAGFPAGALEPGRPDPVAAPRRRAVASAAERRRPVLYQDPAPGPGHRSGAAVPLVDRGRLTGVTTLDFEARAAAPLGLEVWTGQPGRDELRLADHVYQDLDHLGRLSPHLAFPRGSGLPGTAWEEAIPQLVSDPAGDPRFLRRSGARAGHLATALAWPVTARGRLGGVLTLLCGAPAPAACAIELWTPGTRGRSLRVVKRAGVYPGAPATAAASRRMDLAAGEDWIGRAWAGRQPTIAEGPDLGREGGAGDGLDFGLALPVIVLDDVRAVIVFMGTREGS